MLLVAALGCSTEVLLADEGNFTLVADLHIPVFETVGGADVEICWDAMLDDLQCQGLDPAADVDNVQLLRFPYKTQDEVEVGIELDTLQQADMSGYVEVQPADGDTCTSLSAMDFRGTPVDVTQEYTTDGGTYMLSFATGTELGKGTRMLVFLTPSDESDVTSIDVPTGCGTLDVEVDMSSLTPTPVKKRAKSWLLDWSALTIDSQGNELRLADLDTVMMAAYTGLSVGDLETDFFDLESLADSVWRAEVASGTQLELTELADDAGATFEGFGEADLYVLAFFCSSCTNPAPLYLTVLEP